MGFTLIINPAPMAISFIVVRISLLVGGFILVIKRNRFTTAALIISFSSGIIIIFCYCATLSNYEKKSKSRITCTIVIFILGALTTCSENIRDSTNLSERIIPAMSVTIVLAIVVVILSIIRVNKRIFHPTKTRISSYYVGKQKKTLLYTC